ncbi:hypothetical protein KIN20_019707 [Parelaphostrongylus tenuis]|uniref:Uncharacterized protein n=1 Tax=Parelaphostrongylus tenuis TaxID=148309 RepID=A0AAD5N5S1_PARTN|nr:hypothetical protein KIN20_019707 [Parelaphostrongylus tenuis]
MGRHQSGPIINSLLAAISTVLGCGVMPAGHDKKLRLLLLFTLIYGGPRLELEHYLISTLELSQSKPLIKEIIWNRKGSEKSSNIASSLAHTKVQNLIAASTRTFNVTGFTTLPVALVYTNAANVPARVAGIATSEEGAKGFVSRLVMQTIFDVLEREGRSAFLPEAAISAILDQLTVNVAYQPMLCQAAILNLAADNVNHN